MPFAAPQSHRSHCDHAGPAQEDPREQQPRSIAIAHHTVFQGGFEDSLQMPDPVGDVGQTIGDPELVCQGGRDLFQACIVPADHLDRVFHRLFL